CSYFFVVASSLTYAVYCQVNFGTISGTVEDPSHSPVGSAKVTVQAKDTSAARTYATNPEGFFEAVNLAPGSYTVQVEASGFSALTREVTIEVGQRMGLDLMLSVGERRETISVTAGSETLKTQDATIGEVVEQRSVRDLPLNGRMLLDLALTVPGAHMGHGAQTGTTNPLYWRPGQASAISIGGNRPNANYFLLDGVTNTDPTFNAQNLSLSPDAVLEFKVQTGSYSAEMGGAGGGQINIVTRTGTSQFHGTAYEFLRNNAMDARNFN